jgi:hypothetical protein
MMQMPLHDPNPSDQIPYSWQKLLNYRWVVLNLLFTLYLLFLQPLLLRRLSGVITRHRTDWPLAVLLMGVQLIELAGMALKAPDLRGKAASTRGWSFLIWIVHITLNVILLMTAMQALGIPISQAKTNSSVQTALMIGFTLVIFKELGVLFWWLNLGDAQANTTILPPSHPLQPAVSDLLLLAYSAVAFTSLWDWTAATTPIHTSNLFIAGVEYMAASLLFLIAFTASRGLLFIEEISAIRNQQQATLHILAISVNLVIALWLLPRI